MIVICDNCHARYLVPSHAIGAAGRRVRCTTCGHEWIQDDKDDRKADSEHSTAHSDHPALRQPDPAPDIVLEPIPESVRPLNYEPLPVVPRGSLGDRLSALGKNIDRRGVTGAVTGLVAVVCLLAATVPARSAIVRWWPPTASFYQSVGFDVPVPGEGLTFDRIRAQWETDAGGAPAIHITGRIINLRSVETSLPPVVVRFGAAGAAARVGDLPSTLKPQGEVHLNLSYPVQGDTAKTVSLYFRPVF